MGAKHGAKNGGTERMSTPLEQKLSALAEQALAAHGLVLVQAHLTGSGKFLTLQVLTENPDGSSPVMENCTKASRTLSAQLDVADLIQGRYLLEVSSPGLERPLTKPADYTRFIGRQAKLSFQHAQDVLGQSLGAVTGHIVAADDTAVTLSPRDLPKSKNEGPAHVTFPFTVIRHAHLQPSADELALFMKREALPGEVIPAKIADEDTDTDADTPAQA